MRKWIKRIAIAFIVLVAILFIGVNWIIREAFGPKYRTLKVPLNDRQTLIGDETYNADFAAVFYDVEFTLETTNEGTHNLGRASFSDEHWNKDIRLYNISDWFVLPVNDGSYTKILFANKIDRKSKDTIFSPNNLRYDELWKKHYNEIPAWAYYGTSKLEYVNNDKLFVTYEYRIGDYPPFKFYNQTIEHWFDASTGNFHTKRIFHRHEQIKGN